jgi:hypothetical protein
MPDALLNIEVTPWSLPAECSVCVMIKYVLEHFGADFPTFLHVMQDPYGVCSHRTEVGYGFHTIRKILGGQVLPTSACLPL